MGSIATLLFSWAGPLARRVLIAIGIGTITYVGIDAALASVVSAIQSQLGGLPSDIIQILAMGGLTSAMSIVLGGIAARVSMMSLSKLGKVL